MIAVNVVGFKNSGKTTLTVKLAAALARRGRRVAGAKFAHCRFDRDDADTGKLAKVCQAVAGLSPDEAMLVWPRRRYLPDLVPLLECDCLVVEGGKELGWLPRIILTRDATEREALGADLALAEFGAAGTGREPSDADVERIADMVVARGFVLPGLDCATCGRPDCRGLAADIVDGKAEPADCQALSGEVRVTVSGVPLALNPFTAKLVAGTLRGLLGGLKGYVPGGPVTIELDE